MEHAVYTKAENEDIQVVGVYVYDLIILGSSSKGVEEFKAQMKKLFEMSELGLLSYYLGTEVKQNSHDITICQSGFSRIFSA